MKFTLIIGPSDCKRIMTSLACEKEDPITSPVDLESWVGTWISENQELIIGWKKAQGIPVATKYESSDRKYTITKSEFVNGKVYFEANHYYFPVQHPDWVSHIKVTCVLKSESIIVADFEARTEAQDVFTNHFSVTFEKQ